MLVTKSGITTEIFNLDLSHIQMWFLKMLILIGGSQPCLNKPIYENEQPSRYSTQVAKKYLQNIVALKNQAFIILHILLISQRK